MPSLHSPFFSLRGACLTMRGAAAPSALPEASRQTWLLPPSEGAPPLRPREFMRGWQPLRPLAGAPREHGKAMLGTRVTFPSRGKSPKARQGLRPLESPWDSAKLWEPDEVRFEGWNAKPIELKAITIPYRPFRARCASRRATLCYEPSPICHFELVGQPVFISPQATPGVAPPAVNPWRGRWVWLLHAARSFSPFWGEQQAHTCARCWGDDNAPQGEYPEGVAPLGDSLVTFSSGRKSPGCRAERLHHGWSAEEGRTSGAPLLAKGRNPRQRKKKN